MRNRLWMAVMSTAAGVVLSTVLVAPAQAGPPGDEDTGDPGVSIDVFGFLGGLLGGGAKAGTDVDGGVAAGGGVKAGAGVRAGGAVKADAGAKAGGAVKADAGAKAGGAVKADAGGPVRAGRGVRAGGGAEKGGSRTEAGAAFAVEGTVRAVDKRAGVLTVAGVTAKGGRLTQRITVGVGASLRLDGAATVLAKIVVGAHVAISGTVRGSLRLATSVRAVTRFAVKGTVAAVNAAAGTLTVATRTLARTTLDLASSAVVILNGTVSTLAALPLGARVSVSGGVSVGTVSVTAVDTSELGR